MTFLAAVASLNPMTQADPVQFFDPSDPRERDVYEALGEQTLRDLVKAFYHRVKEDPLLRPMFPDHMAQAEERQFLFLAQYFGGPATYTERLGPPRLRLRHLPFAIGMPERNAWLLHMRAAMEEVDVAEPWSGIMTRYFERASLAMINRP